MTEKFREESDLLGPRKIPEDAYWGVQTLRAQENFGVSLVRLYTYSTFVESLAMVKKACTLANRDLGHLSHEYADAIPYPAATRVAQPVSRCYQKRHACRANRIASVFPVFIRRIQLLPVRNRQ